MNRTMLALLLSLLLTPIAAAEDEPARPTPPPDLDGAALAEYLRTQGCPGCLIQGADLAGQNLDGANLQGAQLDGAVLTGATCHGCNLKDATFGVVQLGGADLDGADLRNLKADCTPFFVGMQCQDEGGRVSLRKANLEGADLSGIVDLDVTGAKAEGAIFHVAFPPTLASAAFTKVYLAGEYGSEGENQPFDPTEIKALAGLIREQAGSWVPLGLDFGDQVIQPHRPSFDCAKAGNDTEKALCGDPQLALKDRMLGAAYTAARGVEGADKDALKAEQIAWMKTRNACGAEWGCLSEAMTDRTVALLKQAGPAAAIRTGSYEPSYAEPRIGTVVAGSETGAKLRKLLRYDATQIDVKSAKDGVLTVEAFSLGGNGHMCSIEEGATYRYDPATARYRYAGDDADGESDLNQGSFLAVDRYLIFEGGLYWCGARASLDGVYLLPE